MCCGQFRTYRTGGPGEGRRWKKARHERGRASKKASRPPRAGTGRRKSAQHLEGGGKRLSGPAKEPLQAEGVQDPGRARNGQLAVRAYPRNAFSTCAKLGGGGGGGGRKRPGHTRPGVIRKKQTRPRPVPGVDRGQVTQPPATGKRKKKEGTGVRGGGSGDRGGGGEGREGWGGGGGEGSLQEGNKGQHRGRGKTETRKL